MTRNLKYIAVFLFFLGFSNYSYSQFLPSFAIAGGPSIGWHFNPVKNLNSELLNAGFPQLQENGFLTLGGGGFIDLPINKNFLRIGAFGNGFTSKKSNQFNDTLKKDVNYSFGQVGFISEFVIPFGKIFDFTIGAHFSTGTLKIELYQYGNSFGSYNSIFNELQSNSSSADISRIFKSRFYSVQPSAGIGIMLRKFLYLKIDAGYQFSAHSNWRVDNDIEVKNFPKNIDSKGFLINVGLNIGLFIRDN